MSKIIELKAIKPNNSIGLEYKRALAKLINKMIEDIFINIKQEYNYQKPKIAFDKAPKTINNLIKKLFKKWVQLFEKKAPLIANKFINQIDKHNKLVNNSNIKLLSEKLTVNFSKENKRLVIANENLIQQQINLITNIPQQYQQKISEAVFEAINKGRDFTYLENELSRINTISKKRVKTIAKNQLDYSTNVINRARQLDLGFTKAKWKHSTASKEPRQSHLNANNKVYNIEEGCYIDGEYIQPAEKINCNCYSVPIIEI
jgi:uncharacterized protein with gpF-like domain